VPALTVDSGANATISGITFEGLQFQETGYQNLASAININHGTLTLVGDNFSGDVSGSIFGNPPGGAVFNTGSLTVQGCTFTGNSDAYGYGDAIVNETLGSTATLAITGSEFSGAAGATDGGVLNLFGNVSIGSSTFENLPGAITNSSTSTMVITSSAIINNTITTKGSGYACPGISNFGTLSVTDTTIADNTLNTSAYNPTQYSAAGICSNNIADGGPGSLTLVNDTIAGNQLIDPYYYYRFGAGPASPLMAAPIISRFRIPLLPETHSPVTRNPLSCPLARPSRSKTTSSHCPTSPVGPST